MAERGHIGHFGGRCCRPTIVVGASGAAGARGHRANEYEISWNLSRARRERNQIDLGNRSPGSQPKNRIQKESSISHIGGGGGSVSVCVIEQIYLPPSHFWVRTAGLFHGLYSSIAEIYIIERFSTFVSHFYKNIYVLLNIVKRFFSN